MERDILRLQKKKYIEFNSSNVLSTHYRVIVATDSAIAFDPIDICLFDNAMV